MAAFSVSTVIIKARLRRGALLARRNDMPELTGRGKWSDQQETACLQGHHHDKARHQAPEAGDQRGKKYEFEAAVLEPPAKNSIAHDQEGSRNDQHRDGSEGLRTGAERELAETRQTAGENPVAGTAHSGNSKAERQREQHFN